MDTVDKETKSRMLADLDADTSSPETQIDSHVYRLYGLTDKEKVMKGKI